jgi:hypothetical protein
MRHRREREPALEGLPKQQGADDHDKGAASWAVLVS